MSLSRQILFLIPAMIILSKMFGIIGALCAGPVADGLAFVIAAILLILEYKNLNKVNVESTKQIDEIIQNENNEDHVVITIAREYGSGGRYIGKLVAKNLELNYMTKVL